MPLKDELRAVRADLGALIASVERLAVKVLAPQEPVATEGGVAAAGEQESLATVLREQYVQERPFGLTLATLARAAGVSSAYVSQLQTQPRTSATIAKWDGERAYRFLSAHRLNEDSVRRLAERYALRNVITYVEFVHGRKP